MARRHKTILTLGSLAEQLGAELIGPRDLAIRRVATLEEAGPDDISFLASRQYRPLLATTRAGAVILGGVDRDATQLPRLVSRNPYALFARVSALLNPGDPSQPGVHPSAFVDPAARVADSSTIGPNAVIGADSEIGERTVVGPGCVIGCGTAIGDDTLLHANVTVYHDCVVGDRCIVHSGVVIGGDGFGMAEEHGRWIKVPQIGRAIIGDDVEIGSNTTIDRGTLGDTVVGNGVKLDNQIQIAHNVLIGEHTAVAACAGFAGSSRIGSRCRIGGAAMIHGHLEICDGVTVAAGTMVRRSIAEPGVYDGFFPALPHRKWMRNLARFNHLDDLAQRVQELEERLAALDGQAASGSPEVPVGDLDDA